MRTAYVYTASLMAVPYPTLSHNLVVSGRFEQLAGKSSDTNSVFLNNSAELYKGVSVNLNTGLSRVTADTGRKTDSVVINFGANIVPHRNLTLNVGYSETRTDQSGGGLGKTSDYTRNFDINVSYTPFKTVYLFADLTIVSEKNKPTDYVLNYAATWSPFRDGALQFNFSYNEIIRSEDNSKDRTFTPSLRWNITKRAFLDLSYVLLKTTSQSQNSDTKSFNADLKIMF